ncbi:sugar kinase [Halobacillus sp. ACCC02827]|uniref:sugar kinase n=1 Tax=Bacillaceae TaxID=186817 RepID=UPI0002A4D033|nr:MULTISPECIES: sugar kinase [Bacillaceae]ELK46593.1 kinase, pfkB family protein [Halobacillus sp. BAB-2008]QHT45504.1 sugar kinase [Bacillus sp. SB49]WJE16303.1 sugar kinase [Halobacillus sp. ACCC02827]
MDVVTLGETMVTFTSKSSGLMRYASDFAMKVAGAESNVAIALARLGHDVGFISKVGDDEFGEKVRSFIRGEGVDVNKVTSYGGAPTGIMFKEKLTPNEMRVQYYRKGSAASAMTPDDLDESYIAGARFLHITGITPALSSSCLESVLTAVHYAKRNGVTVVFDPNLRKKLWGEEEARSALLEIASMADIVLPGIDEAEFLFGPSSTEQLADRFHELGASVVIMKLGKRGAYVKDHSFTGYVDGYPIDDVVDPVGAGDAFAAGCLSGLLDGLPVEEACRRGNAAGAMVTLVEGDVEGLPTKERVEAFQNQDVKEDVER